MDPKCENGYKRERGALNGPVNIGKKYEREKDR